MLEDLAPQFTHIRFLRVWRLDLFTSYPAAGLPTLLVYKGGEQVMSRIHAEDPKWPRSYKGKEVAQYLAGYC